MYFFLNDYCESAHPDIITAMQDLHLTQFEGYGFDTYSDKITQIIHQKLTNDGYEKSDEVAVHPCMTGTQANLVCIDAMLSQIDGIIACSSGHIAINEAGAIEALGHKIILAQPVDGKLTVEAVDALRRRHAFKKPHVVRAKAIYISNATEIGTVYTYDELKSLSDYCRQHNMLVLMDGARLGAALASTHQDLTLADIAQFTDIFWIGGTKMGALFGELIVIPNPKLATDFNIYLKRHGGLMAKNYILALQFCVLLENNKFLTLCAHANTMAEKLAKGIQNSGYQLSSDTKSNQVFAILPQEVIKKLKAEFMFYEWEALDDNRSIVRLVTSWATPETQVDKFIQLLQQC